MITPRPKKVRLKDKTRTTILAWKLLRFRADSSLGPLFINKKLVVPLRRWLRAEDHPTKGYAHRPGWHAAPARHAPHLSKKGRVWCKVWLQGWVKIKRPAIQGGYWYLAEEMFVESVDL